MLFFDLTGVNAVGTEIYGCLVLDSGNNSVLGMD